MFADICVVRAHVLTRVLVRTVWTHMRQPHAQRVARNRACDAWVRGPVELSCTFSPWPAVRKVRYPSRCRCGDGTAAATTWQHARHTRACCRPGAIANAQRVRDWQGPPTSFSSTTSPMSPTDGEHANVGRRAPSPAYRRPSTTPSDGPARLEPTTLPLLTVSSTSHRARPSILAAAHR